MASSICVRIMSNTYCPHTLSLLSYTTLVAKMTIYSIYTIVIIKQILQAYYIICLVIYHETFKSDEQPIRSVDSKVRKIYS